MISFESNRIDLQKETALENHLGPIDKPRLAYSLRNFSGPRSLDHRKGGGPQSRLLRRVWTSK